MSNKILDILRANSDSGYATFTAKLIPNIPADSVLGVRSPDLKRIAKDLLAETQVKASLDSLCVDTHVDLHADEGQHLQLSKQVTAFLNDLPHYYLEENSLHALLISKTKDFQTCIVQTETFLPYINNWATSDTFSPDCFKKHKAELLPYIDCWLTGHLYETHSHVSLHKDNAHPYIIRFAIGMLMRHFLGEPFREDYLKKVAEIRHDDYYVLMMQAWYFATALAKQYEVTLQYLPLLDDWTRRKAIQKARESYRIAPEQKQELLNYK